MVTLAKSEPKAAFLRVRCTSAELLRWQAMALSRDLSLSEVVRRLLDEKPAIRRRVVPPADPRLLIQLARVGNNLNQIARVLNRAQVVERRADGTDIIARLVIIDRLLRQLLAEVSAK